MNIDFPKQKQEAQLQSLWGAAFGDSPEFIRGFFATGYNPARCLCVTLEGRVAGGLYWFDVQWAGRKLAYLYAVATHPDFRNRGICRALMEHTHRVLGEEGYYGSLLTPAEKGLRRMYAGMGYEECSTAAEQKCTAGSPVALRRIGREEYARLRRKFLPEGGVIQEGENLSYLETFASFYTGEDFLLAGAGEEDGFRGMELLGNKDAGPGILGALGYGQGTFSIPGEMAPFAMFRPLTEDRGRPGYFGLAFD